MFFISLGELCSSKIPFTLCILFSFVIQKDLKENQTPKDMKVGLLVQHFKCKSSVSVAASASNAAFSQTGIIKMQLSLGFL